MRTLLLALAIFFVSCAPSPDPAAFPSIRMQEDPFLAPHTDSTYAGYRFRELGRAGAIRVAVLAEKTSAGGVIRVWTESGRTTSAVAVSRADWEELARMLEDAGFWSMPEAEPEALRWRGRDGCSWVLEAVRGVERHTVIRSRALWRTEERGLAPLVVFARRWLQIAHMNDAWLC